MNLIEILYEIDNSDSLSNYAEIDNSYKLKINKDLNIVDLKKELSSYFLYNSNKEILDSKKFLIHCINAIPDKCLNNLKNNSRPSKHMSKPEMRLWLTEFLLLENILLKKHNYSDVFYIWIEIEERIEKNRKDWLKSLFFLNKKFLKN